MDALVVPTDPSEPVRVINLNAGNDQLKNLQREVGGLIDIVEYTECDLVINDEGRINGSHVRVTHFVLNDSTMAKVGRLGGSGHLRRCRDHRRPRPEGDQTASVGR